jgi:G3E family GTPase
MEAIITIIGFLGAGKTTLLNHLMKSYINNGFDPFIILNDYENAKIDAQQFIEHLESKNVRALSGNCICCSGINELRNLVNKIPKRNNGITLIEANGTSDACSLMGFLGVGLNDHFLPPIQISVVNVKNWQKRGEHNELEANQIQVSSMIVLTHIENTKTQRVAIVIKELQSLNPLAKIINFKDIDVSIISKLAPSKNKAEKFDHLKTHWSSCSVDLPSLPNKNYIYDICNAIPKNILRVKGCTQIGNENKYTYFERTPDGEVFVKTLNGMPTTGSKLLTIGLGSEHEILKKVVKESLLKNYK